MQEAKDKPQEQSGKEEKDIDLKRKEMDAIILKRLKDEETLELKKCLEITENKLTKGEYESAADEFKILLEIPWKEKKPIYIIRKFSKIEELSSQLQKIVKGIRGEKPYAQFIGRDETYGVMCPVLLRLCLNGEISVEQMTSMLEFSYWQSRKVEKVESFIIPVSGVSPAWEAFINGLPFSSHAQHNSFMEKMYAADISQAERYLHGVKLGPVYLRFVIYANKNSGQKEYIRYADELLKVYEVLYVKTEKSVPYDADAVRQEMMEEGAELLENLLCSQIPFFKAYQIGDAYYFLLPTQTMLRVYQQVVNPNNPVKFVQRVGNFGPETVEFHSERYERSGSLRFPGVEMFYRMHGKLTNNAMKFMHEVYHFFVAGLLGRVVWTQSAQARDIIKKIYSETFTSERFRLSDCDVILEQGNDHGSFYNALQAAFAINLTNLSSGSVESTILILVNMIMFPDKWPSYQKEKIRFTGLLLPLPKDGNSRKIDLQVVEKQVKFYAKQLGNDISLVAVAMLCFFYLEDKKLALHLINAGNNIQCVWRKKEHGHLYLVLTTKDKNYTIEQLLDLKAQGKDLSAIVAPPKAVAQTTPAAVLASSAGFPPVPAVAFAASSARSIADSTQNYTQSLPRKGLS